MSKPLTLVLIGVSIIGRLYAQSSNALTELYGSALQLKNAEKYNESLVAFKGIIEKNPEYEDALYEAGWLSNELKEYDIAIGYLQKAKQLKPSATIYFELGYACEMSGQSDEAKKNFGKALELYPKYYDAQKHMGDIFYVEGNYASALSYYKKYFEGTKSPDVSYYLKAGRCSNESKDYSDALLYLEKYEPHTQKDFARKYTEIGHAYYMIGYNDNAINAYQTALDANPASGEALRGIADVYYNNLEDYSKALEYFKLAIQYDEENSREYYYKSGWIYVQQQKYSEAIIALKKAADYDPKDKVNKEELGYAYYMQNKYDTAITYFNQAIELDAQSRLSYYFKGLCYASLDQKENALLAYAVLKSINREDAEKLIKEIKQIEKSIKSVASNRSSKKQAGQ